jgi:magnesium-transporting ATPase (P-type)
MISRPDFEIWNQKYMHALTSVEDREKKVASVQEEIEVNLELIAATAIEDKLQDKVGETIASLKEAGIQVWVLTGDKIETAINIGFSCQLLTDELEILRVDGKTESEVEKSLMEAEKTVIDNIQLECSFNYFYLNIDRNKLRETKQKLCSSSFW